MDGSVVLNAWVDSYYLYFVHATVCVVRIVAWWFRFRGIAHIVCPWAKPLHANFIYFVRSFIEMRTAQHCYAIDCTASPSSMHRIVNTQQMDSQASELVKARWTSRNLIRSGGDHLANQLFQNVCNLLITARGIELSLSHSGVLGIYS